MSEQPTPTQVETEPLQTRASIMSEYAVIIGAAILLLTVPSLTNRFMFGAMEPEDLPPDVYGGLDLLANMGAFALLVGYVVHVRVGWRRLGLRWQTWGRGVIEGVLLGGLMIGIFVLWAIATGDTIIPQWRGHELANVALPMLLALWLVALPVNSLGEELLRAYVIRRGEDLGWSTFYAGFLSVLLFFSYHTYYVQSVLVEVTLTGGLLMTVYYIVRRNLLGLIVAHTVVNFGWLAISI